MAIVGLLILLVVAIIVIATIARGNDPTSIDLGWFVIRTNLTGVFVAGALTLLLGVLGVMVLLSGLRRNRRRRAEMHELRNRAASKSTTGAPARDSSSVEDSDTTRAPQNTSARAKPSHAEPRDADESFDSAPRDH